MNKAPNKVGRKGNCLSMMKPIVDSPQLSLHSVIKTESSPLPPRQGCLLTASIQHGTRSPNQSSQSRRCKGIQIRKRGVKFSQLLGNMVLYAENPKDSTKILLELMHKFHKMSVYKSTHKTLLEQFCTPTIKNLKWKLRNKSHLQQPQKKNTQEQV